MKHLKRFNEELTDEEYDTLETSFKTGRFTPKTDKMRLKSLYDLVFIELSEEVKLFSQTGKFLSIDVDNNCYIELYTSLDGAIEEIDGGRFNVSKVRQGLVNLLDWNDTNYQEIENILLDYNLSVENIWAWSRNF